MESGVAAVTQGDELHVDVVILTAIKLEFDAVRKVEAGAVPGSSWEEAPGPSGLPVMYRRFVGKGDRSLRVAVALAPDMGATAAVNTLLPLIAALSPRCVAMCGVCAGRRGKVALGDVVAADRLYYRDTGKQLPEVGEQDLTTYKLRDDWKVALEGIDPVALFGGEAWFLARPLTTEWREQRVLANIGNGHEAPWAAVDPTMTDREWQEVLVALKDRKLVAASGRTLTATGRRFVDDLRFAQRGKLPDVSPAGGQHPLRLHVAPIGSGARVVEDEQTWTFVSQAMRKTLGIETEATAIGELAHRQRQHALDWVVMKGVMDFADHGRDDHFKKYAARVSAECLLWFLRGHLIAEPATGEQPGRVPLLSRRHWGATALTAVGLSLGGGLFWKVRRSHAEKLYPGSNYDHYLALRSWAEAVEAGDTLGALQGEVYCEIWTQRYIDGLILQPARLENWGDPPRPRDFTRSSFVINSSGGWLGHIRPPIEGIYDRNAFAPIAASARTAPPYAGRIPREGWPVRHASWAASTPVESIFAPHCESQDRSLSGAFAVIIAQYNLQPVLGPPMERQMVQVGLLRIYERGYVICPMPPPSFDDHIEGVISAQISDNGQCKPQNEVLRSIYILMRSHSFSDTDAATTIVSAGGVVYESGQWQRRHAAPPASEQHLRPHRGFFVD